MKLVSLLLTLLFISAGVVLAAVNAGGVEVHYFIGTATLPLAALLLGALATGSVLSFMMLGFSILRLKAKNRWLAYQLKRAREECHGGT